MSDRFHGSISIGGDLPAAKVAAFEKALKYDTGEENVAALQGATIDYEDEEAEYGTFPQLEAACQKLGLTYRRTSSGKYEFDPEEVYWTPGMKEPEVVITREDGTNTLTKENLQEIFEKLEKLVKGKITQAPRHINSRDTLKKVYAKYILQNGKADKYEILKEYLCNGFGNDNSIPVFRIV